MNTLRSLIFVAWLYGTMTIVTIICLPSMLMPRRVAIEVMRFYSHLVVFGLRWIMGIRIELRGLENVPQGPVVMAGKHQAMLDVFVPFLIFRDPIIVMKRELLWYPGLGWYAWRTRMIPIDREGSTRTMKAMLKAARARVSVGKGRQVIIFPEGTRGKPGIPGDYKPAGIRAFYKALDLPVVPIATNSGLCWPARGITRTPGTIVYEVLPQIEAGLPAREMLPVLFEQIETASQELYNEAMSSKQHPARTPI